MVSVKKIIIFTFCFLIRLNYNKTQGELYSSISDLEVLLTTQETVINGLESYLKREDDKMERLDTYFLDLKTRMSEITDEFLKNPFNCFRLLKWLMFDLLIAEKEANFSVGYQNEGDIFPGKVDLIGASLGLARLQQTYDLNIRTLSRGNLKGIPSTPLTYSDCYEIGKHLLEEKLSQQAIPWLEVAFDNFDDKNKELDYLNKDNIAQKLSIANHNLHNHVKALKWLRIYLGNHGPDSPRYRAHLPSLAHFEDAIASEELEKTRLAVMKLKPKPQIKPMPTPHEILMKQFKTICKGRKKIPASVARKLRCRYRSTTHPFLKIAPLKLEQLYTNPNIYMAYEVLNDNDIEQIMDLAKLNLFTPYDINSMDVSLYRFQKISWISDVEATNVVSRRVARITGLNVDSAEKLQVANYGIGGHYDPHVDYVNMNTSIFDYKIGNRISTVMFYLATPHLGGETVFPSLQLKVRPVKNAALFWNNLHPSGEGNTATLHGACPVLYGTKWVATKWLHQAGNEFLKPCNLEYQQEGDLRKATTPKRKKQMPKKEL